MIQSLIAIIGLAAPMHPHTAVKPRLKRDRGSWLCEAPGFRAWDSTPWKAWFRLRILVARPSRGFLYLEAERTIPTTSAPWRNPTSDMAPTTPGGQDGSSQI